ncbi:MAG: glycosyltransferase [Anaerolineae bacterium]|nr:glycosyltransferase [Anaerolineae bacterium]
MATHRLETNQTAVSHEPASQSVSNNDRYIFPPSSDANRGPYGSYNAGLIWQSGRLAGCLVSFFLIAIVMFTVWHVAYFLVNDLKPSQIDDLVLIKYFTLIVTFIYILQLFYRVFVMLSAIMNENGTDDPKTEGAGNAPHDSTTNPPSTPVESTSTIDYPGYIVMVPMYKEAAVVGTLIENLSKLLYPNERLKVLLLVEETEKVEDKSNTSAKMNDDQSNGVGQFLTDLYCAIKYRLFGDSQKNQRNKQGSHPENLPTTRDEAESCIRKLDEGIRGRFEIVVVPAPAYVNLLGRKEPTTKPRALNYALFCTIDDKYKDYAYCVVYDAEDRPEEDQLLKALKRFTDPEAGMVGCLQAKLSYENLNDNWIISLFKTEYSAWFEIFLPGLHRYGHVIPLGGTSNHFRIKTLKQLGGWDAYNVAEDCDLGVWIARTPELQVEILDSTTWETVNGKLRPWILQRSRWIKGYMQTYFVHLGWSLRGIAIWVWKTILQRPSNSTYNSVDNKVEGWSWLKFGSFQLVISSGFLIPILNLYFWVLAITYFSLLGAHIFPGGEDLRTSLRFIYELHFFRILPWGTGMFFIGNAIYLLILLLGQFKHAKPGRYQWIICWFWLYWLLMSAAALVAVWQFIFKPYHWEKSDHSYTGRS